MSLIKQEMNNNYFILSITLITSYFFMQTYILINNNVIINIFINIEFI